MASEKRLISVEGFNGAFHVSTKKGKEEICFWNGEVFVAFGAVTRALENAPTVDAVEVVHGRWIINPDGYYPYCSKCKEEPKHGEMTNYCPNCGAKMDGDWNG